MGSSSGGSATLVKNLYGIEKERSGGTVWLDECPDYLKTSLPDPDHALIARYQEDRSSFAKKPLKLTSITIQSPYLKQLLRGLFRTYPGLNVDAQELSFDAPFYPFFHRWPTLLFALDNSKQTKSGRPDEIEALLSLLRLELEPTMKDVKNLAGNGNISFALLWTLFPLGCPVFTYFKEQRQCCLVNDASYNMSDIIPTLNIELLVLDCSGELYGWHKITKHIQAFAGSIKIASLPAVPLPFYEESVNDLEILCTRGSTALDLLKRSQAYVAYDGPVLLHNMLNLDETIIFVEGRIIVDAKTHLQHAARYCPAVFTVPHRIEYLLSRDADTKIAAEDGRQSPSSLSVMDNLNAHPALCMGKTPLSKTPKTDASRGSPALKDHNWTEGLIGIKPEAFFVSVIRGFDLTAKSWAEFQVDNVSPVKWNENAFDALVIDKARKRLLEALVKQQQNFKADAELDDVVAGKGQGLIMLLAGPPGTGKTLTAESIADRLKLPLYSVSASQLGDTAKAIENRFGEILRLAATWNAVLLLDEADAFLEKRVESFEAQDRNKRVAAFLRILEYYKGILILTTNKAVNFDEAFYSRIHLTLTFEPLDQESRKSIWKNFLHGVDISSADLTELASEDLNGREIKNIMKMARLLARNDDEPLSSDHIRDVLDVAKPNGESCRS